MVAAAAKQVSLRDPFPASAIGKLPRAIGPKDKRSKGKCAECGGYHELPAIHLDYVGHAHVTERLLDVDPAWTWAPLSVDMNLLPSFDRDANNNPVGLWIKLTVSGVTRLGYGSVESGTHDAVKQLISDALRNAAMRFGVALDCWKKDESGSPPKGDDMFPAKPRTVGAIRKALETSSVSLRQILDGYGVDALEQLTEPQASAALRALAERAKTAAEDAGEGEALDKGSDPDSDARRVESPPPPAVSSRPATPVQLKRIRRLLGDRPEDLVGNRYDVVRLDKLSVPQAEDAIRWLETPEAPPALASPQEDPSATTESGPAAHPLQETRA